MERLMEVGEESTHLQNFIFSDAVSLLGFQWLESREVWTGDNFGDLQTPTTVPHGPWTYFPQRSKRSPYMDRDHPWRSMNWTYYICNSLWANYSSKRALTKLPFEMRSREFLKLSALMISAWVQQAVSRAHPNVRANPTTIVQSLSCRTRSSNSNLP